MEESSVRRPGAASSGKANRGGRRPVSDARYTGPSGAISRPIASRVVGRWTFARGGQGKRDTFDH